MGQNAGERVGHRSRGELNAGLWVASPRPGEME